MSSLNGVMMQYFEWNLNPTPHVWNILKEDAAHLRSLGIIAVWTPPAYKGAGGIHDVGYGVYDIYDLGEFMQKGAVETKYGTKNEFLEMIQTLHNNQIQVYADIVLDHKMGADETEMVKACTVDSRDREEILMDNEEIEAWTKFTFPERKDKYSDYHWCWNDFNGIDYDQKTKEKRIFGFYGKEWNPQVDTENVNYDYLMGADIDFENPDVVAELKKWGLWFLQMTGVDGFRIDAVKHIQFSFYKDWLNLLRKETGKELFAVGEYWSSDVTKLIRYLQIDDYVMSLFDVPLHFNFLQASNSNGNFDMSKLLENTLLAYDEYKCVTFVDNHDTQPGQALQSWILEWFKPMAYAIILLRKQGYPCIFYGDYYGIPSSSIAPGKPWLDILLKLRQTHAYGEQHDYFDHYNIVGFTREGDEEHPDALAVIMTDCTGGEKHMYIGIQHAHKVFRDALHNHKDTVLIADDGWGDFYTNDGSISVYIPFS